MPSKRKMRTGDPFERIFDMTLLPGENHRDFEDLLRALYEEYFPAGTTEEDLARPIRETAVFWSD